MKAAGFEATPAEEMDFSKEPDGPTEEERKILRDLVFSSTLDDADKEIALTTIETCPMPVLVLAFCPLRHL